jgi:hypothetical protein
MKKTEIIEIISKKGTSILMHKLVGQSHLKCQCRRTQEKWVQTSNRQKVHLFHRNDFQPKILSFNLSC